MTTTREPVLLIGAGGMGIEYAKVLSHLEQPVTVVGRGEARAAAFREATGLAVASGGVDSYLAGGRAPPARAIVAVGVELTADVASRLIAHGVRQILLEKPGGLNAGEIRRVAREAQARDAQVWVAYNRRFYRSVERARSIIAEDGGLTSVAFEFTEWSHVIEPMESGPGTKEHWFLANSTHVVDTVFHLAGVPAQLSAFRSGSLAWHPSGSAFVGAGITTAGVPFSYHANWESAGRWGIELQTRKRRLILRPMEQLATQARGSVAVELVDLGNDDADRFKPGLLAQVRDFIGGNARWLCPIQEQARNVAFYDQIAGYRD